MSSDFFLVLGVALFGLLGHAAVKHRWAEWVLRSIIGLTFAGEALYIAGLGPEERLDKWNVGLFYASCATHGLSLMRQLRGVLSNILTAVDILFAKQFWQAVFKDRSQIKTVFASQRVFVASSMPHLAGLYIYIMAMCSLLASISPSDLNLPSIAIPLPAQLDQLFSYNGLGLCLLAICGVGYRVSRSFKEVLVRLALVKPYLYQVSIAVGLVLMSFTYDWIWSLYTQGHEGMGGMLRSYNTGTFASGSGAFGPSVILALATAVFAGVGEETLIRGALQPVFGILPAAILHGVLHGQFTHAPLFIIQVAGWSTIMGVVRRYTNTTTTIMGHAGYNFCTTFLFAFNPPDL